MEKFKNLKPDDEVFVCSAYSQVIKKVERVTKTLIVISDGSRFRKDGNEVGGGFNARFLMEVTPESKQKFLLDNEKKRLENALSRYQWKTLSLEKLREIKEIINRQ